MPLIQSNSTDPTTDQPTNPEMDQPTNPETDPPTTPVTTLVNSIPSLEQELREAADGILMQEDLRSVDFEIEKDGDEAVKFTVIFEYGPEAQFTSEDVANFKRRLQEGVRENSPPESDVLEVIIRQISD